MLVYKGYKTEISVNNKQRTLLLKHAGAARWAAIYDTFLSTLKLWKLSSFFKPIVKGTIKVTKRSLRTTLTNFIHPRQFCLFQNNQTTMKFKRIWNFSFINIS